MLQSLRFNDFFKEAPCVDNNNNNNIYFPSQVHVR